MFLTLLVGAMAFGSLHALSPDHWVRPRSLADVGVGAVRAVPPRSVHRGGSPIPFAAAPLGAAASLIAVLGLVLLVLGL